MCNSEMVHDKKFRSQYCNFLLTEYLIALTISCLSWVCYLSSFMVQNYVHSNPESFTNHHYLANQVIMHP
jgi:hypothetical protein